MALAGSTTTYIDDLIGQGPDALSNLYYIEFEGGEFKDSTTVQKLKVRAGDFKAPAFSQTTDKKNFMTVSVDMPKPEIQGDKKLSFTFRVDENFEIYQKLVAQKRKTSISNLGYVNPYVNREENNFAVKVYAYIEGISRSNAAGIGVDYSNYKLLYKFYNCWIRTLDGLTFTYDNSTPLTVKVEISFQKFDDPENLIFVRTT